MKNGDVWVLASTPLNDVTKSKLAELVRGLKDARKRLCIDVHRSRVSASTRTVFPEVERDVAQMIASTYGCGAPADR